MSNSGGSIDEDRLGAKRRLYDMQSIVATKQVALASGNLEHLRDGYRVDSAMMPDLLSDVAQTKLATDEERESTTLVERYATLDELEQHLSDEDGTPRLGTKAELAAAHEQVVENMGALSHIQPAEWQREQFIASRALRTVDIMTHD